MRSTLSFVAACLLAACGGDSTGTQKPQPEPPISMAVTTGSQASLGYFGNGVYRSRVTLQLRNNGGKGSYQVEFYSLTNVPNGPDRKWGVSESVEVLKGYQETVSWTVDKNSSTDVDWVIVYNRDYGSATYRRATCYDFGKGYCASE